jgi:hypothetical protein
VHADIGRRVSLPATSTGLLVLQEGCAVVFVHEEEEEAEAAALNKIIHNTAFTFTLVQAFNLNFNLQLQLQLQLTL